MIIKSKKGFAIMTILSVSISLLLGLYIYNLVVSDLNLFNTFLLIPIGLLIWMIFGTYYQINETEILYFNGPIKGKIQIKDIQEITANKTLWVGLKPALASKGVIIKYNKYDEIYFSPIDNKAFINELLKINPEIKVV